MSRPIIAAARLLAVVLLLAGATGGRALAAERILRFVSDVTVERNGDVAVVETIGVQAEQNQIRHGILRDFPTTYTRPDGSRVVVGFAVQSVTLDGAAVNWATEPMANGVRVRIGSADTMVSTGPHEFVIRYRSTRQIGFFADYDELYWNATGTGWTFPIDVAEARVTLPEAVPFRQTAFYTGPQGAKGQDAAIVSRQPGAIVFRTTRALPPRSGLTVAASWPKGVIAPPSPAAQAGWWLEDNLPAVVAGLGLVAIVAFYAFAWWRVGRDPPAGTIIPLFGPPDGMSAAAVRFVERMAYDARCFTAVIIELGVNGHLRLTGTGAETVLWRRDGGKPIGPAERAVESKLFVGNPSLKLVQSNYKTLGSATSALQDSLKRSYDGALFTDNYGWSGTGLALTIAWLLIIVFMIGTTYDSDRATLLNIGILVPIVPIAGGALLIRTGRGRERWGGALMALGAAVIALAVGIGLGAIAAGGHGPLDVLPGVAAWILAPLALLGFHWLQTPTAAGRAIMDHIEGFRLYLGVAEEDRLNALNPPDKTPELFERFLPYAFALGVENRWAQRFAAVLAAAGTSAVGGLLVSERSLGQRSGRIRATPRRRALADDRVRLRRARIERRRLVGRRLIGRRGRWRRRIGVVRRVLARGASRRDQNSAPLLIQRTSKAPPTVIPAIVQLERTKPKTRLRRRRKDGIFLAIRGFGVRCRGDCRMRWNLRFATVLVAVSALCASDAARAEWVKVEPPEGGFSVFFPGPPTAKTNEKPERTTRIWSVRVGKILCTMGMTDYNGRLDAEQELQLDMENFLKQIEATATSQKKLSFRDAPDGPLPALQFSFTRTGWTGQSLVVVAGDRSYQSAALAETGSDTKDLARCVNFKVTAKSRHYQP